MASGPPYYSALTHYLRTYRRLTTYSLTRRARRGLMAPGLGARRSHASGVPIGHHLPRAPYGGGVRHALALALASAPALALALALA